MRVSIVVTYEAKSLVLIGIWLYCYKFHRRRLPNIDNLTFTSPGTSPLYINHRKSSKFIRLTLRHSSHATCITIYKYIHIIIYSHKRITISPITRFRPIVLYIVFYKQSRTPCVYTWQPPVYRLQCIYRL